MSFLYEIILAGLILWVVARTVSFALWNWRENNKLGSVLVMAVAAGATAIPVYIVFFKT